MEFLSLSRRRSSSQNVPQWRWARRNVCRSQARSEIGSGFGESGGTPPPRIPRSAPRSLCHFGHRLVDTLIHWRFIFLFKIHMEARFSLSGSPNILFIFPTSFSYVAKPFKGTGKEFRKNLQNLLCCSEFCQLELSKRDFRSAVDRLNSNVLHLCFTQVGKVITDMSNQCLWTLKRKKKRSSP